MMKRKMITTITNNDLNLIVMKIYFTTIKIFVTSFTIYVAIMWILALFFHGSDTTYDKFLQFFKSYNLIAHVALFSLMTSASLFSIKVLPWKKSNESETLDDPNFMSKKSVPKFDSLAEVGRQVFYSTIILSVGILLHLAMMKINFYNDNLSKEEFLIQLHLNSGCMEYYLYTIILGVNSINVFSWLGPYFKTIPNKKIKTTV